MTDAPKRRRYGVRTEGAEGTVLPTQTPRGLIRGLAELEGSAGGSLTKPEDVTPRGLLRGFHDAALTATPSTANRSVGASGWSGGQGGPDDVAAAAAPMVSVPEGRKRAMDAPPLPRIEEKKTQKFYPSTVRLRARRRPEPKEYPMRVVKAAAHRFMMDYAKPNTFTAEAMEALHASAGTFFANFCSDYEQMSRISTETTPLTLNRKQISQLVGLQGLLDDGGLVDAVNEFLDREDADAALGVPKSQARMARERRKRRT